MPETQASVVEWRDEIFPKGELPYLADMRARFLLLLEETVELGIVLGIQRDDMGATLDHTYSRDLKTFGEVWRAGAEAGDVQISLWCLADLLGLNVDHETRERMRVHRTSDRELLRDRARRRGRL